MSNSKVLRILLITLFAAALACVGVRAQDERKCAKYGEYCQTPWECCSNKCLSYSYRCVGTDSISSQTQQPAVAYKPTMTLDQLLDAFSRTTEPPKVQSNFVEQHMTLERLLGQTFKIGSPAAPQLESRFAEVTAAQDSVAGESVNVQTTLQCKQIGEKCYRHEECCTKLCHGFLHQCVT